MIVVADTSPINYLLLIGQLELLPRLFEQIILPDAVCAEMQNPYAPPALRHWIANPPDWVTVQQVTETDVTLAELGEGEKAAITLAVMLRADFLIIDERLGRRAAEERGLQVIGVIGVLDNAVTQGWIDLDETIAKLRATNFRISKKLIQSLQRRHR
ncbi:MAG: DUF3368 domain-containing protein [Spirulinaceae cyanobacterium]